MRIFAVLSIVIAGNALAPTGALAAEPGDQIRGRAVALDGDTLLLGDQRVRLFGIDAPEMAEPDGWYARAALDDLLAGGGGLVVCTVVDTDRYRRPVAVCDLEAGTHGDLGHGMVLAGWAAPWRTYSYRDDAASCPDDLVVAAGAVLVAAMSGCFGKLYDRAERLARERRNGRWARMPLD